MALVMGRIHGGVRSDISHGRRGLRCVVGDDGNRRNVQRGEQRECGCAGGHQQPGIGLQPAPAGEAKRCILRARYEGCGNHETKGGQEIELDTR